MDATEGMQGGRKTGIDVRAFILGACIDDEQRKGLDEMLRSIKKRSDEIAREIEDRRNADAWRDPNAWQDAQPHA